MSDTIELHRTAHRCELWMPYGISELTRAKMGSDKWQAINPCCRMHYQSRYSTKFWLRILRSLMRATGLIIPAHILQKISRYRLVVRRLIVAVWWDSARRLEGGWTLLAAKSWLAFSGCAYVKRFCNEFLITPRNLFFRSLENSVSLHLHIKRSTVSAYPVRLCAWL